MIPTYGYCAVTADFLHIGHKRFIEECSNRCGKLIVGIMTNESVKKYKGRCPIMDEWQRAEVVQSLKFVGFTIFQNSFEFPDCVFQIKKKYGKDFIIFDSEEHQREGADIIIPRTKGISSTDYRERL